MSIEDSQNLFFATFHHILFLRSGPGPLGPVRKILVVRSGSEGPQFARSVETLLCSKTKQLRSVLVTLLVLNNSLNGQSYLLYLIWKE